jgi:hypothetical protein
VEIVFISRRGCGICQMMEPAWEKIKEEKPEWHCYHYTIGVDKEADEVVSDFPNNDNRLPMFCVYEHNKPIGYVSGGNRYREVIRRIEEMIYKCP